MDLKGKPFYLSADEERWVLDVYKRQGLPRVVPELQHAAHRGVELSARLFIHLAAEQQEVYYLSLIHI